MKNAFFRVCEDTLNMICYEAKVQVSIFHPHSCLFHIICFLIQQVKKYTDVSYFILQISYFSFFFFTLFLKKQFYLLILCHIVNSDKLYYDLFQC